MCGNVTGRLHMMSDLQPDLVGSNAVSYLNNLLFWKVLACLQNYR